jgi:hypothetical protein
VEEDFGGSGEKRRSTYSSPLIENLTWVAPISAYPLTASSISSSVSRTS